jgi:hypothetical protein
MLGVPVFKLYKQTKMIMLIPTIMTEHMNVCSEESLMYVYMYDHTSVTVPGLWLFVRFHTPQWNVSLHWIVGSIRTRAQLILPDICSSACSNTTPYASSHYSEFRTSGGLWVQKKDDVTWQTDGTAVFPCRSHLHCESCADTNHSQHPSIPSAVSVPLLDDGNS